MDDSDEVVRPVALMTFAVLAVLGFLVTTVLTVRDTAGSKVAQEPDATIATEIENQLRELPGVRSADVTNAVKCEDDCDETESSYSAVVDLNPNVTSQQISSIVSSHDSFAPDLVGMRSVPITLRLSEDKTLNVASVHYGFGVTQADAFLTAVNASAGVSVAYGPSSPSDSPLLTVRAMVPGLVCANADEAMSQVVPAVSAAATAGGIPFGSVQFDCGSAELEAGIVAGSIYQPGWSEAATAVDRLCRDAACGQGSGVLQDVYVSFEDNSTVVTVELNDGQQLAADNLVTVQGIVNALSAAGAASPQLDLNNY